ncbi:hypothetical protein [Acidaminobacter hydrogenoformans]|uniref:Uncharacterized protein n=1 Tax=Acidaminobacter hydrogenoformans DSM 2784 TaxID=1120920 RepID=A0A1G5RX18_9FIRM|nr:hypothetical protein [Acidaminobacter hydrogenoformans]SCZ78408.1 hypothetical protein SAMN03080599_01251 [Acidaminobacter hydrogenoformans DSM 2784]
MRVLLIGQKIVTLEDLNSYFFEQHVHGYACVGAPNILSLDIVRYSGIHMVICQTSDYSMEHLTTFMSRVKEHDIAIVTLLISESTELSQINEPALKDIDDLLVLPFTPSEFHTRLLKLILKSKSPHSKANAEDWLKSMLTLMSDSPGTNEKGIFNETNSELDIDMEEDQEYFVPDLELLKKGTTSENSIKDEQESNETGLNGDVSQDTGQSTNDVPSKIESAELNLAGLTPSNASETETITNPKKDTLQKTNITVPWIDDPTRFTELMEGIDFDRAPISSESSNTEADNGEPINDNQDSVTKKSTNSIESVSNNSDSNESQTGIHNNESKKENIFNKFLELFGRMIYFLLIVFLILFSIVVVKSYYDGGVATFGDLGIYSNTEEFLYEKGNLLKGSFPGALIVAYGVGPDNPFGEKIISVFPWLGYMADYAKTSVGFLIVIVIPLLIIFIIEIYYWIQRRKNKKIQI